MSTETLYQNPSVLLSPFMAELFAEDWRDPLERELSFKGLQAGMERLAEGLPEVERHFEALQYIGESLIDVFKVKSGFFEDDSATLAFLGGAKLYLEELADPASTVDLELFMEGFYATLTVSQSELEEAIEPYLWDEHQDCVAGREIRDKIYDEFTNTELTEALKQLMVDGDILDHAKDFLGLKEDDEAPYEVRVLNVTSGRVFGMLPSSSSSEDRLLLDAHAERLRRNGVHLAKLLGYETFGKKGRGEFFHTPYAERYEDGTVLYFSATDAEILAYSEEPRSESFSVGGEGFRHRASGVAHEYAHAQKSTEDPSGLDLTINGHTTHIGSGLEERRCDAAGNYEQFTGYRDIASFDMDLQILFGVSMVDIMSRNTYGGTKIQTYGAMAETYGLSGLVQALNVNPGYTRKRVKGLAKSFAALGGSLGVIDRLSRRVAEKTDAVAVRGRIQDAYEQIDDEFPEDLVSLLFDSYFMSEIVRLAHFDDYSKRVERQLDHL